MRFPLINGLINIEKEKGFTSHDVVAKVRGILKQKKVGHTGTLDPDATGVLPVCLGSGTKLCDMLHDQSKEYVASLRLGIVTDTQDISGEVIQTAETAHVTEEEVREVITSFLGDYWQIPPMYSAKKVNGKKLYELAREGKEIERKPSLIQMSEIEILEMNLPDIKIRIHCSKGSYIRTLCHDIGAKLQVGAVMTSLIRTRAGQFLLKDSITLKQLEELRDRGEVLSYVIPTDQAFLEYQAVYVKSEYMKLLENGNGLPENSVEEGTFMEDEKVRVYNYEKKFFGLYCYDKDKQMLKAWKMFLS